MHRLCANYRSSVLAQVLRTISRHDERYDISWGEITGEPIRFPFIGTGFLFLTIHAGNATLFCLLLAPNCGRSIPFLRMLETSHLLILHPGVCFPLWSPHLLRKLNSKIPHFAHLNRNPELSFCRPWSFANDFPFPPGGAASLSPDGGPLA